MQRQLYFLKSTTYLFFMSADQFFYVMFSTFTNREVFGLLTYYYSEVLLYSLIFGVSMLATSAFEINNCMFYRDAFLVVVAVCIHMIYVYTQNQTVVWGSFGLYVVYIILDWKNDAFTHMGLKLFGKIKDDDSFEGDYPMQLKRKAIIYDLELPERCENTKFTEIDPEEVEAVVFENQERFDRNIRYHRIYTKIALAKEIQGRRKLIPGPNNEEVEDVSAFNAAENDEHKNRVRIRMNFAVAVYKFILYLRYRYQLANEYREEKYKREMIRGLNIGGDDINLGDRKFPEEMANFDDDRLERQSARSGRSGRSGADDDNQSMSPRKNGNLD